MKMYEEYREQLHEKSQHLMADLIAVIKKMTGLRRQSEPNFPKVASISKFPTIYKRSETNE